MTQWKTLQDGTVHRFLIGVADITGFAAFMKSRTLQETYRFMKDIASLVSAHITKHNGLIISYIGDAVLFLFSEDDVDTGVKAVHELNGLMLDYFQKNGLTNRVTFSLHFGEAVVGKLPPFDTWDIYGEDVNLLFLLEKSQYKGRIILSPQVFRKLSPETRKLFHKFTPPVVYLSD
ncbi:MAG: adenylate/guanylate cyclase domain-containing protein [Spirochaetales bacterium]|nr:adenylate/guanylate cyclase domain-containing protein [Spirochaetales bacterium]